MLDLNDNRHRKSRTKGHEDKMFLVPCSCWSASASSCPPRCRSDEPVTAAGWWSVPAEAQPGPPAPPSPARSHPWRYKPVTAQHGLPLRSVGTRSRPTIAGSRSTQIDNVWLQWGRWSLGRGCWWCHRTDPVWSGSCVSTGPWSRRATKVTHGNKQVTLHSATKTLR